MTFVDRSLSPKETNQTIIDINLLIAAAVTVSAVAVAVAAAPDVVASDTDVPDVDVVVVKLNLLKINEILLNNNIKLKRKLHYKNFRSSSVLLESLVIC